MYGEDHLLQFYGDLNGSWVRDINRFDNRELHVRHKRGQTDKRTKRIQFGAFSTQSVASGGNILIIFLIINWPNFVLLINPGFPRP